MINVSVVTSYGTLYTNHPSWYKTQMYTDAFNHTQFTLVHSCSCTTAWWWPILEYETNCQVINIRKRVSCMWLKTSVRIQLWHVRFVCRHGDGVIT